MYVLRLAVSVMHCVMDPDRQCERKLHVLSHMCQLMTRLQTVPPQVQLILQVNVNKP